MIRPFTYLLVEGACIVFPLLFSFHPRIRFYLHWKRFFLAALLPAFIFILWDMLFTRIGVWRFNPEYVTGIYLYNLPVEEVLFFFCIPFACIFTWYCFSVFVPPRRSENGWFAWFSWLFALALVIAGILFIHKLYTGITFITLGFTLAAVAWKNIKLLPRFFGIYLLILLPFFLSNGVLTGAVTQEPVVLYNDAHNLGIRIFTIPVEDAFYGMLLLLLNYVFFMQFRSRSITG